MNKKFETGGALLFLAIGLGFTLAAYRIPEPLLQQDMNTTPAFFPIGVGVLFSVLSLALLIKTLLAPKTVRATEPAYYLKWIRMKPAVMIMAVLLAYLVLMQITGWIAGSFLMTTLVIAIAAGAAKSKTDIRLIVVWGLLLTVTVFIIFDRLLGVPLPDGTIGLERWLGL